MIYDINDNSDNKNNNIDNLRKKLDMLLKYKAPLDKDVIELSKIIDLLILKYYKNPEKDL